MNKCPLYLDNNHCFVKITSNPSLFSFLSKKQLPIIKDNWPLNCQGNLDNCSFITAQESTTPAVESTPKEEVVETKVEKEPQAVKVSVHKIDNPYAVKADVLIYPTNNVLTIDDSMLHRLSRGAIQAECDKQPKPIKMGHVYITSNGGDSSQVKAKIVYHAVVAGESRLANEEDMRSAIKKALILAESNDAANVVMIPCDCGTHDIEDTARVQLSSIHTFLRTLKTPTTLRNIFIVMEDEVSYKTFEEYYKRIF